MQRPQPPALRGRLIGGQSRGLGPFGHQRWLLGLGVGSVAVFLAGYFVFDRLRDSFAEEV